MESGYSFERPRRKESENRKTSKNNKTESEKVGTGKNRNANESAKDFFYYCATESEILNVIQTLGIC